MDRLTGQQLLEEAMRLLGNQDLKGALKVFDVLVEKIPDAPFPLLSRCTCLVQLGKYKEALKDGEKVLLLPNSPIAEDIAPGCTTIHSVAYMRLAKCYKEFGQNDKAAEMVQKRAELEKVMIKDLPEVMDDDDSDKRKTREETQQRVESLRQRGNELYKMQRFTECINTYAQALELDPNNLFVHSNQAQALIKLGELDRAMEHVEQCLRIDYKWPKGHYRKGCVLLEKQRYKEAMTAFETAQRFGAKDDDLQKKIKTARQMAKQFPDPPAQSLLPRSISSLFSAQRFRSWEFFILGGHAFAMICLLTWWYSDRMLAAVWIVVEAVGGMFRAYFGDFW